MDYKINYVTYNTGAYTYITYLQCNTYTAYSTIQLPTIQPMLLTIQMLTLLKGQYFHGHTITNLTCNII